MLCMSKVSHWLIRCLIFFLSSSHSIAIAKQMSSGNLLEIKELSVGIALPKGWIYDVSAWESKLEASSSSKSPELLILKTSHESVDLSGEQALRFAQEVASHWSTKYPSFSWIEEPKLASFRGDSDALIGYSLVENQGLSLKILHILYPQDLNRLEVHIALPSESFDEKLAAIWQFITQLSITGPAPEPAVRLAYAVTPIAGLIVLAAIFSLYRRWRLQRWWKETSFEDSEDWQSYDRGSTPRKSSKKSYSQWSISGEPF